MNTAKQHQLAQTNLFFTQEPWVRLKARSRETLESELLTLLGKKESNVEDLAFVKGFYAGIQLVTEDLPAFIVAELSDGDK